MNLKPRFHLKPVKHLLKWGGGGGLEEEALEKVKEFVALLNKHSEKTVKDVRARMKRLVEKSNITAHN